jgi:hypothetical protein
MPIPPAAAIFFLTPRSNWS